MIVVSDVFFNMLMKEKNVGNLDGDQI